MAKIIAVNSTVLLPAVNLIFGVPFELDLFLISQQGRCLGLGVVKEESTVRLEVDTGKCCLPPWGWAYRSRPDCCALVCCSPWCKSKRSMRASTSFLLAC